MASLQALQLRLDNAYVWATRSWLPALLVILVTFALAARLLDDYPILPDGLRSIATAGGLEAEPSLAAVFDKLTGVSQQHMPGYFLALFFWGKVAGWEPLALRALSVFFGLLSLALIFRLARDFIAREAGIYAIVMLASLSFYNLWYLPIRMYSLFAASGLWLLWLYLRLVLRRQSSPGHYALFFLSCIVFLYSQVFSTALALGLALFHLFFPPKTRHWFMVAAMAALAGLTILPWLSTLLTGTAEILGGEFGDIRVLSPVEALTTILSLSMNANLLFLALLTLSLRPALKKDPATVALWTVFVAASAFYALVNWATGAIDLHRARYFVALLPVVILLLNVGLFQLRRLFRQNILKWLCLGILLFWIASGLLYQRRVGAHIFVRSYDTLPIHLIERHLRDDLGADFGEAELLAGWSGGLNFAYRTPYGGVSDYYFADHAVDIAIGHTYELQQQSDERISARLTQQFAAYQVIWLVYELDSEARFRGLYHEALALAHARCFRDRTLANVVIEHYQRGACA